MLLDILKSILQFRLHKLKKNYNILSDTSFSQFQLVIFSANLNQCIKNTLSVNT